MDNRLEEMLFQHRLWMSSLGKDGKKLFLEDKVFKNIILHGVDISDAVVIGCKFERPQIQHIKCPSANLCSSSFSFATFLDCNAVKAEFNYSEFFSSYISGGNLSKADLSDCVFRNCQITNCKFINVLFADCIVENMVFDNVDFSGALIDNVSFGGSVTFRNVIGFRHAQVKSIVVHEGADIIQGAAAIDWLSGQIMN